MAANGERLVTGTVLGRYRLETLLGTGGMASVWKARDERLGRTVAVKVLSETLALDPQYVRRFEREAKIAARLSHPNLVGVFDFGVEGERPYLVSEYVDGGTLAEYLDSGATIDVSNLSRELLGALDHIHSAGVVHRDVKPANVLIDAEGRARLTDFGIAQPDGATQLTRAGQVIGTRGYMAPEVEAGGRATKRSDLYSCGIVLAECLGTSSDTDLDRLVDRLTAADPGSRPRTARRALRLLEVGGSETAVVAATLSPAEPMPAPAWRAPARWRRRRLAIAALGAAAALLVVALVPSAGSGGSDRGGQTLRRDGAAQAVQGRPLGTATAAAPKPAAKPGSTPISAADSSPAPDPCAGLDPQRAFGAHGHGEGVGLGHFEGAAGKQIKRQFESRKHAIEQWLKRCAGGAGGSAGGGGGGD